MKPDHILLFFDCDASWIACRRWYSEGQTRRCYSEEELDSVVGKCRSVRDPDICKSWECAHPGHSFHGRDSPLGTPMWEIMGSFACRQPPRAPHLARPGPVSTREVCWNGGIWGLHCLEWVVQCVLERLRIFPLFISGWPNCCTISTGFHRRFGLPAAHPLLLSIIGMRFVFYLLFARIATVKA